MGKIDEYIKDNPVVAGGVLVIFVVIMAGLGVTLYRQTAVPVAKKKLAVVEFVDGQNTMEVNRSGMVRVNTPQGTFNQNWTPEELAAFFAQVESRPECFDNVEGSEVVVGLTYDSGDHVDCTLEEVGTEVAMTLQTSLEEAYEAYNLLPSWQHDVYLGQIRQIESDDTGAGPTPTPGPTATPTPVPGATPTPTPEATAVPEVVIDMFGCDDIEDDELAKKTVINGQTCDRRDAFSE